MADLGGLVRNSDSIVYGDIEGHSHTLILSSTAPATPASGIFVTSEARW